MDSSTPSVPPPTDERTSVLLRRILAELPENEVRIGYVVLQLRRRSFGGILIMLAALGLLPGISFFAGLAMIVPGLQLLAGFRAPLLPRFVRQRQIDVNHLRAMGEKAAQLIERIERFVKPRWVILTFPPVPPLIGILVTGLALVVMLPLPFSNLPPAVALLCLSLGLLERDGLMILIGIVAAAIALAIGVLITYLAIEGFVLFLGKHFV